MKTQILWTACVTPFDKSGDNVDYSSLKKLVKLQEKSSNGIVLFGSTGEGISLQDHERKKILEFVLNLGLSIPIIVGVPNHNLYQALEWIKFCNPLNIDGYMLTTPIYTKPGIAGQTGWFEKLLQNVKAPAILYNIPSRAGVKLYPETIKNLYGHDKLWAIKDSSGGIKAIIDYKEVAPNIKVFCGDDNMLPVMAVEGACGLISIASNAWASATRKYVEHCLKCKLLGNNTWWHSTKVFCSATNPIPIKALLHRLGIIEHPTVRLPLSLNDLPSLQDLDFAHQSIMDWDKEHV